MAVTFGLLAALLWGLTDFLAQRAGRAAGIYRTMFYGQIMAIVSLGGWLAFSPGELARAASAPTAAWAAVVGAVPIGILATVALYRALLSGRIATVVPIAASYGAVSAALSILSGEPAPPGTVIGLVICAAGAILCARPAKIPPDPQVASGAGLSPVLWAATSALAYGALFWLQGRFATPALGAIVPVWVYYALSFLLFLVARLRFRLALALPKGAARILVPVTAAAALSGYVALSIGFANGEVAIVTVISSFQSGVTVLLARLILKERLGMHQIAGVAAVMAGLMLVHSLD